MCQSGQSEVVLGDKPSIRDDSQYIDKNLLERLSSELSLMSSVYHKHLSKYIYIYFGRPWPACISTGDVLFSCKVTRSTGLFGLWKGAFASWPFTSSALEGP